LVSILAGEHAAVAGNAGSDSTLISAPGTGPPGKYVDTATRTGIEEIEPGDPVSKVPGIGDCRLEEISAIPVPGATAPLVSVNVTLEPIADALTVPCRSGVSSVIGPDIK
jgi:hypothetical protein